jgi:predicted permease
VIFKQLLVLYIFIFLGWLFGRLKPENAQGSKLISFLLVNLFLPSKVFSTFSQSFTVTYLKENYATFFISVAILVMLVAVAIPLSALLTKKKYERRVYRYSFAIANYAYMGYSLIESTLGKNALANMITFCIPFVVYTYTFGYAMLTGDGKIAKKLLNTMTVAIVLGCTFGLAGIRVPSVLGTVLSSASACVGPLSMILVGLVLSTFKFKELLPDTPTVAFVLLRLIGLPALIFGVCKLLSLAFTLPASVYPFAVIAACMPCGLNTVVFPRLVGEDCRQGARMVLYSHALSIATIPLWMMILT